MLEAASITRLDSFYVEWPKGSRATALGSVIGACIRTPSRNHSLVSTTVGQSLTTCKRIEVGPLGGTVAPSAHWSSDSKSILYTVNNNNVTNIWSQPFEGGPAKQVTEFKDSLMTGFAWSRDGKTLATTRGVLVRDAVLIADEK